MASLYEIDAGIQACIDFDSGEIIDSERLNELVMERNTKIENVACWVKNLSADVTAFKAEADAFKERAERAERKMEQLKNWLVMATGGEKMNLPKASISFRNSEKVMILSEDQIPAEYMVEKVTKAPDKKAIKDAIKQGEIVHGCELVANKTISIK